MYILGLNAYHGDSAACLIKDGQLVAAVEEERIRRVKHWAGLPTEAIRFCLETAGITLADVDHIAVGRSGSHLGHKLAFLLRHPPHPAALFERIRSRAQLGGLEEALGKAFDVPPGALRGKIRGVEHHRAHIASAFLVSPFENAAVLSVDGMGDFVSTMWGVGEKNRIKVLGRVFHPHSLGFVYTALTQYLGFWNYGDEYKVMGLAGFGRPSLLSQLRKLIIPGSDADFKLNLKYFTHHRTGARMSFSNTAPAIGQLFSREMEGLLGAPARKPEEELNRHHQDVAASLQALYEENLFRILDRLHKTTKMDRLAFAGGTAQNSLANGKIFRSSAFREVYIPPAGHDAGTAVGAAFSVWHEDLGKPRSFVMENPFWGAEHDDVAFETALKKENLKYEKLDDDALFRRAAELVAKGKIVGWFQGRTEWGPRALGNRSIVANPAFPEIKEILNVKIKKREPFRPFAPSILEENVGEYFEEQYPVPFMEKVYAIRPEKRDKIPAVVHVDGTGRLQSVSRQGNPRYYRLIQEVGKLTGVPMVLNTSFNENEPIVNRPEEAVACYLRTKMDALVLGNYVVIRND